MSIEKVNRLFMIYTEATQILQQKLNISYLDALLETAENLLEGNVPDEQLAALNVEEKKKLHTLYVQGALSKWTTEEKRKSFQLALLKGMKEDYIQPNHQMTPDTIGQLMAFFIQLFLSEEETIRLAEFGIGTGNLLSVLLSVEKNLNMNIEAEGIEIDELLISLAAVNFALQDKKVKVTHQNALTNLLLSPVDVVVSDLPIGYYPDDETAKTFSSSFKEGHSYAHYLLIEQGMRYLKPGGLGMFLIPSHLFEEEQSTTLITAIREYGFLQAIVELPKEWFYERSTRKSLMILQNKGKNAEQAKEVLFAKAPDFKNQASVHSFLSEIREWKQTLSK